ncbi:MAG: WD40 repeat domain-containing protein [Pleurocapsa sp. MO_192.B19]|nr:WD40 repeat domain-containing protein [Pleurocapsa sp. MO_192.B19]
MNNSSIEATVSWLVNRLDRGGLLRKLELSDEDIADILWLACQMGAIEAKPKEPERNQTEPETDRAIWQDNSKQRTEVDSKPDEVSNVYSEKTIEPELTTSSDTKSLPFQAPAAPAIQNTLSISRKLRPLMKKFPSSRQRILDEEATVSRIAERGIFVPVTKPEPERWLDLELIVEQSRSSFIWQETIDELRQILEIHGAFRSVRVWNLSEDKTQLQLVRRKKGRRTSKRQHSYRELIHSDGRGLVLLVSDCVSSIWQQGKIHHWLQKWSQKQPTAIVQLFPERMWDSTQLGVGRKLFSSALTPGVANPKLILQNLPAWIPINWQQALVLPVVNLEPEILKQWSRVVAGSGKARISTYLFDLDFVAKQAKQETTKPEVKTETSSQTAEDINSQKEREAEIILKRFLATASITAQRLAGMMAAAPVDMRVVDLIRKTLLPEATPVHVAEVYMGGILESKVGGESRIYQFRDGVRRLLNKAMAQYETEDVLDTISRYIAEEIDRPIRSFTALLALLPTYSQEKQEQILPFAQVAVEVLKNLGGAYARFAEEIEDAWKESNDERLEERNDERAALLARQAYLFVMRDRLHVLALVDNALRRALSAPYFSNILKHHSSAFSSIAFSPDGTKLAAGNWDGNIYLWNLEQSYSEFKPLVGHTAGINAIAFSLDGAWLVSASEDGTIKKWDLHQKQPSPIKMGKHEEGVTSIAFSPDGSLLASGSKDRTVKLWNWHQPEQASIVLEGNDSTGRMGMVRSLTFSPDGSTLAVGCENAAIWIWNVRKPTQTLDKETLILYGHGGKIRSVAFSPNEQQLLASASDDYTIRLWDITQPEEPLKILRDPKAQAKVRSVAFSFDGKMLASASDNQTIRLWKTDQLEEAPQILRGHTFNISSIAFSPDGQYLASCGWDNTVRLWDLNPPVAVPKILPGHHKTVRAIAISQQDREGSLLASGSEDGTVRVWNLNQPYAEPKTFAGCRRVFGVALFVSSDRRIQLLAAGSDDKIVRLWDLQQPSNEPMQFEGYQDGVSSVAFSPDGRWLASGSWKNDATVRLWNLNQLDAEPIILKGHTDSVTSVKFSPDGKILASASDDNRVLLWNIEQLDADPIELKNHSGRVWSIAFSPDGQLLASASDDRTVGLWNLRNLAPENLFHVSLIGHSDWVSSVTFSPDGKTLASGSFDRSIRLWQIDQIDWKARKIHEYPIVLEDHDQSVSSVAFTPDGKYLASGSFDNTVRLWIASTDVLADIVCQKVLRNLTRQEWQQFMGDDIPYERTCPNLPPGEGTSEKAARAEEVSELEREFRVKLALLKLYPGQKYVLEFIKRQTARKPDISEEDVTNYLNKPKGDGETYHQLETLRLLDFLEMTDHGHGPGTIRYALSPRYREYLSKTKTQQTE